MWNKQLFMTRAQIREYDRLAIEDARVPSPVLMENAGRGAADLVREMLGGRRRLAVLAGPGNNGGDGFVIARHLLDAGYEVKTYLAVPRAKIKGDALMNLELLESMEPTIIEADDADKVSGLDSRLKHDGFVVDALLGTGVARNVEGHLAWMIEAVNRAGMPVLAVDIPSGLDADSGTPWGVAVRADATATFGHLKRGLVLYPGASLAGRIHVVPIGVPGRISERAGIDGRLIGEELVRPLLPIRTPESHKGTFGHLLLLAGSVGKTGAAAMAGLSAMRVGTGLVTIATTAAAQPILEARCNPVLMTERVIEKTDAPLTEKDLKRLEKLLAGKRAVALGPGITTAKGIAALALKLLQTSEVPAVVDADGVNILAGDPSAAGRISAPMVLTPHPGEMARLMGKNVPAVQEDRIGTAREAAARHQVVIVLKGAHTVISAPDGQTFVNPTGNPGMATGGTGDVLTGMIGGFLAQGRTPLEAALLGVYLHGLAGDRAAARLGQPSLIATDLIDEIPDLLKEWTV